LRPFQSVLVRVSLGSEIGDTDYRLSAVPLGGYVKFRGENLEMLQGESAGSIDEFLAHPKWKRFLVAIAGPAFNIATAILIPAIGIMIGFRDSADQVQKPVVGRVVAGSAAEISGLQPGDRISPIRDGRIQPGVISNLVPRFVRMRICHSGSKEEGRSYDSTIRPTARQVEEEQVGESGIEPFIGLDSIRILAVRDGMPAAAVGLKPGDRIVNVNGQPIRAWHEFKDFLRAGGTPVTLSVERADGRFDVTATPVMQDGEYRLGFSPDLSVNVKTGFFWRPRCAMAGTTTGCGFV
jgi:regulator of sigma E protease